jgi:hypothetical protein
MGHLQLLIGLNRPINRLHPGEEHRHCGQQLFFEQRDLFFPIGLSIQGLGIRRPLAVWVASSHSTTR